MAGESQSVILGPGEGPVMAALGNEVTTKISSGASNGALWIFEYTVGPNFGGPPPHIHQKTHEVFYVLEGVLGMRVDGNDMKIAAGGMVMAAPGTLHTFYNDSSAPVRYMGILTPGTMDGYFQELPEIIAKHGYPPPAELMAALGPKYDIFTAH